MREIINGVMYNTATATKVGEWSNGYSYNDFNYCEETLYRKVDGSYFLVGEGGPFSDYCGSYGNSTGWGISLIPYTVAQAKKWAEKRISASAYESEFGPVPENTGQVSVCFTIGTDVRNELSSYAKANGLTIHKACDSLLRSALHNGK